MFISSHYNLNKVIFTAKIGLKAHTSSAVLKNFCPFGAKFLKAPLEKAPPQKIPPKRVPKLKSPGGSFEVIRFIFVERKSGDVNFIIN